MKYIKHYLIFAFIPAFLSSLLLLFNDITQLHHNFITFLLIVLYQFLLRRKMTQETMSVLTIVNIITYLSLLLCLLISQGSMTQPIWNLFMIVHLPYALLLRITVFTANYIETLLSMLLINGISWIICLYCTKTKLSLKKCVPIILAIVISLACDYYLFQNSPAQKYKGHQFEYMNGFSSTDLSHYTPYAQDSLLVTLPEDSQFIITDEKDMPILDGAEACYPVYSAIAKAVYQDIDHIEEKAINSYSHVNGKIVTFTNSSIGYSRLIEGSVDMFFGAKPSQSQLEEAQEKGIEFEYTPIGKEAFVFFVNEKNPIDNLTSQQIKDIYHGSLTHWQDVGGKSTDIVAFQRPERSGSQVMMNYFMGDVTLKEPLTYEMQSAMGDIIHEVAEYYNEDGAIGYTFKYFLEGLNQEKHVKILSIDGIYPTNENIKDQTYPLSTYLYCVTLKPNQKENVQKLKEFLLSPQGQYIIEETGYCALN